MVVRASRGDLRQAIKRTRKQRQKLSADLSPQREVIKQVLGRSPGTPEFRDRLGRRSRGKVQPVPGVTVRRLAASRSVRRTIDSVTSSAAVRLTGGPPGAIVRILKQIRKGRELATVAPAIQAQRDVTSLYQHLGIADAPALGRLEATRQPIYDLIDFERLGRAVRLSKTSAAPNQGASFQFQVPEDFAMRLHAIEVSSINGPGNTTMSVLVGWIGAAASVKYTEINVQGTEPPMAIFGTNIEKSGGEYTRESPLDIPQNGVLTINSGLDFNAGQSITITIQYELKPAFNQISSTPQDWIVN